VKGRIQGVARVGEGGEKESRKKAGKGEVDPVSASGKKKRTYNVRE